MRLPHRPTPLASALLALVVPMTAGCWPHGKYVRTIPMPGQVAEARPPASIPVHDADKPPAGAYEVIAGVQAVTWSRSWTPLASEKELRAMMAEASSKMGAEAVVGFTWWKGWCGRLTHPSAARCARAMGLAAKPAQDGGAGAAKRLPFALAVLPVETGETDPVEAELASEEIRRQAKVVAEEKGYYVFPGAGPSPGDIEDLPRLDGDALRDLGDRAAEFVLVLETVAKEELSAVLLKHDRWVLQASLFSKSSRDWVWRNEHLYDFTRGVGLRALQRSVEGVVDPAFLFAVGTVLANLPPVASVSTEVP